LEHSRSPSCVFLSAAFPGAPIPSGWTLARQYPASNLEDMLDRGADIFRSMWDRQCLLVYMDVDYLNADLPGHAFARPAEVFQKMEPTYQSVVELLNRYRIGLLAVMTGRGYQLTGKINLGSALVGRLASIAPGVPDWYETQQSRLPHWIHDRFTTRHARAYVGLGLLLEYLAHQVIRQTASKSPVPLVINGTNVGFGPGGREAVSLDLSFAGDPMDVRHMRVAFGGYQLHRFRPDLYGAEVASLDPLIAVPRGNSSLHEMLHRLRSRDGSARLAESSRTRIPIVTDGVAALLADYDQSSLARFHRAFYSIEPDHPGAWSQTYDRFDLSALPPCVAASLVNPHDLLLKPEYIQHVTRFLMSEG
jgi:hypothetical protein